MPFLWYAVILAGGGGTRLWPISIPAEPKQFQIPPGSRYSLLEATIRRMPGLRIWSWKRSWVITREGLRKEVETRVPRVPSGQIIGEPSGKNTLASTFLAALHIQERRRGNPVMVICPSDHDLRDDRRFKRAVRAAIGAAICHRDWLVVLGAEANRSDTGLGWIKTGAQAFTSWTAARVYQSGGFAEKPELEEAEQLLADRALWNTGVVVARAATIVALVHRYCRDDFQDAFLAMEEEFRQTGAVSEETWESLPELNFNAEVTTPAALDGLVYYSVVDGSWSDVGHVLAFVQTYGQSGAHIREGDKKTSPSVINTTGRSLITRGDMTGYIVVWTVRGGLLVVHRDSVQLVTPPRASAGQDNTYAVTHIPSSSGGAGQQRLPFECLLVEVSVTVEVQADIVVITRAVSA